MTAREVLQRLVDACEGWNEQPTTLAESRWVHAEYVNSYGAARAYLAQPEPQDDCRVPREPTFEMTSIGVANMGMMLKNDHARIAHIWQCMYDAAIAAQEKESAK